MENNLLPPEVAAPQESLNSKRKRRKPNEFLSSWLTSLRRNEMDSPLDAKQKPEQENEEESASTKKKNRLIKLLNRLGIVERPKGVEASKSSLSAEEEENASLFGEFMESPRPQEQQPGTSTESDVVESESKNRPQAMLNQQQMQRREQAADDEDVEAASTSDGAEGDFEGTSLDPVEERTITELHESQIDSIEHGPGHPHPSEMVTIPLRPHVEQEMPLGYAEAGVQSQPVVERVIEHQGGGAALAAFAGAELLSRHRDKKLDNKIKATQTELKDQGRNQQSMEAQVYAQASKMEQHKAAIGHFESPTPTAPAAKIEKQTTLATEAPNLRSPEDAKPKPQSVKEILKQRNFEQLTTKEKVTFTKEVAQKKAEALSRAKYGEQVLPEILHDVAGIAENDVPLEDMLEHRHEAMDDDKQLLLQQQGYHTDLAQKSLSGQQQLLPALSADATKKLQKQRPANLQDQYKQAAMNGAWAALILLIFVLILLLLR